MRRASGAICGSATHCSSNTSIGFRGGLLCCAAAWSEANAAHAAPSRVRERVRLRMFRSFAGAPALLLMFIDHANRLHEGVADGGADEAEAALLERLAHRIALGAGRSDVPQGERA